MYRIAVCEDEPKQREGLCAQCRDILTQLEVEYQIEPFASAEELEVALMDGMQFDLLCLDILLTDKTGMELAMEVRKWDEQISILFITSFTEFLLEGYGARPIQYLLKPVKPEELERAIQTDLRLNHQPRMVTLRSGGKTVVLPLADIRYVESQNHGCVFCMDREEQFFQLSLTQVETLLPKAQFCRCHHSYLVNLAQIKEVTSRELYLSDGSRLTIGRRYAEKFQTKFICYLNLNSR